MKRLMVTSLILMLIAGFAGPLAPVAAASSAASSAQTYTVLVGGEDPAIGMDVEGYFPATLHLHPGDTVNWVQNTFEIHTVTFLPGTDKAPDFLVPMPNGPQGAMIINPQIVSPTAPKDGMYDGSTFANSGVMGRDPGMGSQFSLTFTKPGTYNYLCDVHNMMKMTGTIIVDDPSTSIPSPVEVSMQAKKDIAQGLTKAPAAIQEANGQIKAPIKNSDGSMTYTISVGYNQGQTDMMRFFPRILAVHRGDTVIWDFNGSDMAPHTITFLNGAPIPDLITPIPQPNGPPWLTFSKGVAVPQNADQPLTNQGIYNSGVIDPMAPGPHTFSLKIGDVPGIMPVLNYLCQLHDDAGMTGMLIVLDK